MIKMKGIWVILSGIIFSCVITQSNCGLYPYYLHFPPPPVYPILNRIDSDYYPQPFWPQSPPSSSINTTKARVTSRSGNSFPSGPIPFVVHSWQNPDNSEGTKLQNGTLIYFVGGPWGGIRTSTPTSTEHPPKPLTGIDIVSNSIDDFSLPDRAALLQRPSSDASGGYGWSIPIIVAGGDNPAPLPPMTTASPTAPARTSVETATAGSWGKDGYPVEGLTPPTQESAQLPDITTTVSGPPSRTQILEAIKLTTTDATRTTAQSLSSSSTTPKSSTQTSLRNAVTINNELTDAEKLTEDPIAAATDARYPVSPSVRKFRRIVARIRALAKKELRDAELAKATNPPK